MTLRTLNYGNYGIFLIMGNAGFLSINRIKQSVFSSQLRVYMAYVDGWLKPCTRAAGSDTSQKRDFAEFRVCKGTSKFKSLRLKPPTP